MTNAKTGTKGSRAGRALAVAEVDAIRNAELVEQRRAQIMDAALELFLQKGFRATTVRDICAASGVNQASFYDYVANKEDILRRLLNRMFTGPDSTAIADRRKAGAYPSIEAYLQDLFRHSWTVNRQAIQLSYRVIRDLDSEDRRAVLNRDRLLVDDVAGLLRAELSLPEDDQRAAILANLVVFINAFVPMRDWNMRDLDDDLVLQTITSGMAAMIRQLAQPAASDGENNESGRTGRKE